MRHDIRDRQHVWEQGFTAAMWNDDLRENPYMNVKDRIAWNNGFRAGKAVRS